MHVCTWSHTPINIMHINTSLPWIKEDTHKHTYTTHVNRLYCDVNTVVIENVTIYYELYLTNVFMVMICYDYYEVEKPNQGLG